MKTILFIVALLISVHALAQVFPVQVTPQLLPPYSPYLSDYTTPASQKFIVHVHANDLALSNYRCRLKVTIEGAGIMITTKKDFMPAPIALDGSIATTLYGDDLREYFDPDALEFAGYTRNEYEKSGRLPEGMYRFTVEVLDYNRGTVVSNKGMATAWITLNDPPLLNLPANNSQLTLQDPPNILFSWTPRHTGSVNAAFSVEYIFRLVEIWPENRNAYDALLSQPPLYEIATSENQIIYGPSEPALIPGRSYAWQVEARDTQGKDLFKNGGRTEAFRFKYGEELGVPANLELEKAKVTSLTVRWDAVTSKEGKVKYRIQYRPRRRVPDHRWYEAVTTETRRTISNLRENTDYELRVRAELTMQDGAYTPEQTFTTLAEPTGKFVCRDNAKPPPPPANSLPVFPLSVNDTIHAGGFAVLVRDVMKRSGQYYGAGVAIVPWLNGARVRVTFEKIEVNDRFWLTSGSINSVWQPESRFLLEEETPLTPGNAPHSGELDITVVAADTVIAVEGAAIATVTKDEEGNTVVITTDGQEQVLKQGGSYAVVDEAGNGYVIDERGNVAKTTATEARAAAARGARNYELVFRFEKGDARFGFDENRFAALSHYYQQLDNGGYVAWKALSASEPELIAGRLQSDAIGINDLRFQAGGSPLKPVSSEKGNVVLSVQGKGAGVEEELVVFQQAADSLPATTVGKLNLVTYDAIQHNLVIVPVNGASMPGGLDAATVSRSLNAIYSQAVVQWRVSEAPELRVELPQSFDDGDAGMLSNYTGDMKKVLRAYGPLQQTSYYLFLIDEPRNMATLGYMPRNKRAGFVFVEPHAGNSDEFLKTVAHELGHGAFNLKHTFSEHALPAGTTDNIMDYSQGTALYKYQWDYIHEPRVVLDLFGGEEGQMVHDYAARERHIANTFLEEKDYNEWLRKVREVYEFLKACGDEEWQAYDRTGIIPYCFWRDCTISPALHYSNADLPFVAGIIDGAYSEGEGLHELSSVIQNITNFPGKVIYSYTLAHWDCRTEKMIQNAAQYERVIIALSAAEKEAGIWSWVKEQWNNYKGEKEALENYFHDCRDAQDLRILIEELYQVASNWEEIRALGSHVCNRLAAYWNTIGSSDNEGRYLRGKLLIPAATLIVPVTFSTKVEKLKNTLRVLQESPAENWKALTSRLRSSVSSGTANARHLTTELTKIYEDCIAAGYKVFDHGTEILIALSDNTVIAKISENVLHIKTPHGTGWAAQSQSALAKQTLTELRSSGRVYRLGTFNKSDAGEAQYWSSENPFEFPSIADYAKKYGIPEENLRGDEVFFEVGTISDQVPYITREAPGFGTNPGGAIEVVVPRNGVKLESFNAVKLEE